MGDETDIRIRVTPAQKDALKRYCKDKGIEVSAFVRQVVFKIVDKSLAGDMPPAHRPKKTGE